MSDALLGDNMDPMAVTKRGKTLNCAIMACSGGQAAQVGTGVRMIDGE